MVGASSVRGRDAPTNKGSFSERDALEKALVTKFGAMLDVLGVHEHSAQRFFDDVSSSYIRSYIQTCIHTCTVGTQQTAAQEVGLQFLLHWQAAGGAVQAVSAPQISQQIQVASSPVS
jgi:hypothetical protein